MHYYNSNGGVYETDSSIIFDYSLYRNTNTNYILINSGEIGIGFTEYTNNNCDSIASSTTVIAFDLYSKIDINKNVYEIINEENDVKIKLFYELKN